MLPEKSTGWYVLWKLLWCDFFKLVPAFEPSLRLSRSAHTEPLYTVESTHDAWVVTDQGFAGGAVLELSLLTHGHVLISDVLNQFYQFVTQPRGFNKIVTKRPVNICAI